MDALTTAAASGMRARMESLDMLANNLANASTAGFKVDREFYSTWMSAEAGASNDDAGIRSAESPVVDRQWTDFSQGMISPTGNPLDLALDGDGFFVAQSANGPVYTRNGSFHLDNKGILSTSEGYPVLNGDNKPIQLDPAQPVTISEDGSIQQGGATLGTIAVVRFTAPADLDKEGHSNFSLSVTDLKPVTSEAHVRQGYLEAANVQPAETAVRLVSVMRQFDMLQRAMSLGNGMNQKAIEDVAKVTA
jgi:flagellar basal-body rod protein FlgF